MNLPVLSYNSCNLCPRNCKISRTEQKISFCGETADLRVACACLHFGEEPPITAVGGSGTIFITGCNLGCDFCQNYQISRQGMGTVVSTDEFADICLHLQDAQAENINIVTGSHAIPALAEGLAEAKKQGLTIPVCWNSSAFESLPALNMLDGLVDIWLPDLKTLSNDISLKLFRTDTYPKTATDAILRMIEMSPMRFETFFDEKTRRVGEKMLSGVIIRHLILPDFLNESKHVLDWLKTHADSKACISIMTQYTPIHADKINTLLPDRFISCDEFEHITAMIQDYQFEHAFYQELIQDNSWLPDFNRIQPFSNELAKPLWHWEHGML